MDLITDEQDGLPVARFTDGEPLPGGDLAWESLGVGHRCQTHLAWSATRCCPVVVKFPRPHQLDHPRARASLRREAAALQGNPHPCLPQLYTDGTDSAVPYLVSEYVDGPTLEVAIDETGAFDPVDVALLGAQLFSAVAAVHAREIAHVDVKPENVVLRDGRVVLLDFGSARRCGAPQPQGKVIGSPGYAAPELEAGAPIGPAMDVYGIGLTVREALSGEVLFDPDLAARNRPAAPSLPPDGIGLGELVDALIAVDPAARPTVPQALQRLWSICATAGRPAAPAWLTVPLAV